MCVCVCVCVCLYVCVCVCLYGWCGDLEHRFRRCPGPRVSRWACGWRHPAWAPSPCQSSGWCTASGCTPVSCKPDTGQNLQRRRGGSQLNNSDNNNNNNNRYWLYPKEEKGWSLIKTTQQIKVKICIQPGINEKSNKPSKFYHHFNVK